MKINKKWKAEIIKKQTELQLLSHVFPTRSSVVTRFFLLGWKHQNEIIEDKTEKNKLNEQQHLNAIIDVFRLVFSALYRVWG